MSIEKIQRIIDDYPRHYARIIKNDPVLYKWVQENSPSNSDHLPTLIYYSALTGESNICPNGKSRTIKRFSLGFTGCGPASNCICTSKRIANSVSQTKKKYSTQHKQEINNKR